MKVSQSNGSYLEYFDEKQSVDIMAEAGFDAIDFGFFNEKFYNKETDGEEFKEKFLELKRYAESKGVLFNQAHAPFPTSTMDEEETEAIFRNVVRSMRNASYLGIDIIVVHPKHHLRYKEEGNPEKLFEENIKFFKRLEPYCEKYNIRVALENLWQGYSFHAGWRVVNSVCSKPDEFVAYLDALNSPWFVACLDIGHSMIVHQDPAEFIKKLGKKYLKALHVHDVEGNDDSHTIPYLGGMGDWDKIANALNAVGYEGDFTMEAVNFLKPLPVELYPIASKMIAETGRYVANKI